MEGSTAGPRRKASSTEYRQKLKVADPAKYADYLRKQRETAKKRRDLLKMELKKKKPSKNALEQKQLTLEKARERQAKFRTSKKENIPKSPTKIRITKPNVICSLTRTAEAKQREQWRLNKRIQRTLLKLQPQKYRRMKEKDTLRKRRKKLNQQNSENAIFFQKINSNKQDETECTNISIMPGFASPKSKWNSVSKVRKSLPKSPTKFASVLTSIINRASPRKRKAMDNLKGTIQSKIPRPTASKLNTIKTRARRKDRLPIGTTKKVQLFYLTPEVSRQMPQKRYVTKHGPGHIMVMSLQATYITFRKEYPTLKIGFRKFAMLRPKQVRLLTKTHLNTCVCPYCANVIYKLNVLNRLVPECNRIVNEQALVYVLLCEKSDAARFHQPECVNGTCKDCKGFGKTLVEHYKGATQKTVTWNHWERVTNSEGKVKRDLVVRKGSVSDLVEEFVGDVVEPVQNTSFPKHFHTQTWQTYQYMQLKSSLRSGEVLVQMDFARNREIIYQDAIKALAFSHDQTTLHPIVMFYKENDIVVRDSLIILTDDNNHDYHAVEHFFSLAKLHLTETTSINPTKWILFTDGAAGQYKSKGPFADLTLAKHQVEKNFFGSEHGKGECDGEGGVIKTAVDKAVNGRLVVVNSAKTMYDWCKDHLAIDTPGSKRTFKLVKEGDITRNRPETEVGTVPGTRQFHQVRNTGRAYKMLARKLSCFCHRCRNVDVGTECANVHIVGEFEEKSLNKSKTDGRETKHSQKGKHTEKALTSKDGQVLKHIGQNITFDASARNSKGSTLFNTKENQRKKGENTEESTHIEQMIASKDTERRKEKGSANIMASEDDYKRCIEDLNKIKNYAEYKKKCIEYSKQLKPIDIVMQPTVIECKSPVIDKTSLNLMPDLPTTTNIYLPLQVLGDGDCLPRSASVIAYGNEDHPVEMRLRISVEMALNENMYMDTQHLRRGTQLSDKEALKLITTFVMFSDHYTAGRRITPSYARKIFETEAIEAAHPRTYMGIWQLFALSSVLGIPLFSVYPQKGNPIVRSELHRIIAPIMEKSDSHNSMAFIMWTTTRTDMRDCHWVPNHFVPLLKQAETDIMFSDDESETNEFQMDFDDIFQELEFNVLCEPVPDSSNDEPCSPVIDMLCSPVIDVPSSRVTDEPSSSVDKDMFSDVTDEPISDVTDEPISSGVTSEPSSGGVTSEPSSGVTSEPSRGGVTSEPSSGGVTSEPSSGVTCEPSSGGVTSEPSSGGVTSETSSGVTSEPSSGVTSEPSSGGVTSETSSGVTSEPSSGGVTSEPSSGVTSEPSSGVTSEPSSGGVTSEPSSGVTSEPSSGVTSETSSGVTSEPSSGGVTSEPSSGVTSEPSSGVTSEPSSGGVTSEPSSGVTSEPSSGVTSEPSSGGVTSETSSGVTSEPSSGVTSEPSSGGVTSEPSSRVGIGKDMFSLDLSVGRYMLVKQGKITFPAVIVSTPEGMCCSPTGVWGQCFRRKRTWTLEEKPFFFLFSDIINSLDTPSIHCAGSRFYFEFENV